VEEDGAELLRECGDLLQFMMEETAKEKARDHAEDEGFGPSHHDYFRHNPHEYERQRTLQNSRFSPHSATEMAVDVVVKMGGAFLTEKGKVHCLRPENVERAAADIAGAFEANLSMMLVHGAGSFGHFEAKKYKLNKGLFSSDSAQGMVLCRAAVSILHQNVLAKLLERKLPVISVSPNGIVASSNGVISKRQFKPMVATLRRIVQNGMIPLVHGDIIFDDERGCHILSGDVIVEHLAAIFGAQRAVFWSDIDGVYDCTDLEAEPELIGSVSVNAKGLPELDMKVQRQLRDPEGFLKEQQDEFMKGWTKRVDAKQSKQAKAPVDGVDEDGNGEEKEREVDSESASERVRAIRVDATGGMWKKVQIASRICALGTDVVITKGGTEDAQRALMGKGPRKATVFVQSSTDESML